MRIGVMGGTFDPIHHGHLVAASEVGHFFELDEVIFVPTGQPWQKNSRKVSEAEDRYLMTVIATASNPSFSVSRVDIDRPGDTYTIDTLRDLHAARGPAEFFFITGADALQQLMSWQDADELFKLAHFVGCTRPGHRLTGDGLPLEQVSLIEIPALAISSTACRQRVGSGQPIWYLVPDGIVQYIVKRRLYQAPAGSAGPAGPAGSGFGVGAPGSDVPRAGAAASGSGVSGSGAAGSGAAGSGAAGSGASEAGAPGAFRDEAADSEADEPDAQAVGADPGPAWPEPADRAEAAEAGRPGPPGPRQRAGSE